MQVNDKRSLSAFIDSCPIIDHHAHPLLPLSAQTAADVVATVTEAHGEAQDAAPSGLPFIRAFHDLTQASGLLTEGLSPKEQFQRYLSKRSSLDEGSFTQNSFTGIQTLLIDDGLRHSHRLHPYDWHSQFLQSPAKRIVRVETLAEDILQEQHDRTKEAFLEAFEAAIRRAIADKEVAGFKSAVCYRTGLSVSTKLDDAGLSDFLRLLPQHDESSKSPLRIKTKAVNDYIVNVTARLIRESAKSAPPKPIQFHTGLGDNDLQLHLANPSHLQPFIEAYPEVPIVLLHASYPFTKEAGYLACVFANVYLDVGEVFPMLSRSAQEQVLRDALALTPVQKLCWSTDGHFVQETYSIAVKQVREVLKTVLYELMVKKDCSFSQAAQFARQLLFDTSNQLYHLNLQFHGGSSVHTASSTPLQQLEAFLAEHREVRFIRHSWVDYTGTIRTRVQTVEHLRKVLSMPDNDGRVFEVVTDAPFLLQNDAPGISDFSTTGQIPYIPDYSQIYLHPRKGYTSVMGDFKMQEGGHHHQDPRTLLRQSMEKLEAAGIQSMLLGFELEFHLYEGEALQQGRLVPISKAHAWSTSRSLLAGAGKAMTILEEIVIALQDSGVEVAQFHSESGAGQYEIPLGPLPVMKAVDQLIHAKEVVAYLAAVHGYRATFHPRPVPTGACSGMHLHLSFEPATLQNHFYAGVLEELPSICAFSLGGYHSYDRVIDGAWTGGTWCAWGDQNRDAPLRRIDERNAHWELKAFDGLANPYLAVSAVLTAGRMGIEKTLPLQTPISVSAHSLSPEERAACGIKKPLPKTLKEAMATFFSAMGKRTSLLGTLHDPKSRVIPFIQEFGPEPAIRYTQVKEQELALLKQLEPQRKDGMSTEQVQLKTRLYMVERY